MKESLHYWGNTLSGLMQNKTDLKRTDNIWNSIMFFIKKTLNISFWLLCYGIFIGWWRQVTVLYCMWDFRCLFRVTPHVQRGQCTWEMQQYFCPNMNIKGKCTYLTQLHACFLLIYWLTLQLTQLRDELPGGRENVLDGLSKRFRLNANHSQTKNNEALAPNKGKTKQN